MQSIVDKVSPRQKTFCLYLQESQQRDEALYLGYGHAGATVQVRFTIKQQPEQKMAL